MKKHSTLLIISIIILIISIIFWIDIHNYNQLIRNEKLNNIESACYEKLLITNYVIGEIAKRKKVSIDEIKNLLTIDNKLLFQSVDTNHFVWRSLDKNNVNNKDNLDFDSLFFIESCSVFLLFKDSILVDYRISCNIDTNKYKLYLNDTIQTND